MANCKGTNVVILRKMFHDRPKEEEKSFLAGLSAEDAKLYQTAMPITWVPIPTLVRIYEQALPFLYPGDPLTWQRIGRDLARDNLTSIYKSSLKLTEVAFAFAQAGKLWRTYVDQGRAQAEKEKNSPSGYLLVTEAPDLPSKFLDVVDGFIAGVLELAGAHNVKLSRHDGNPKAWKWHVKWE